MPKRTRETKPLSARLHPERLAQEARTLRQRAKQSHGSETRIEFEEMAERLEVLALAIAAMESETPADSETPPSANKD